VRAHIPTDEILRIDVCWAGGVGFTDVDLLLGSYYHTRHCQFALRTGDPGRIARALAMEAAQAAAVDANGNRARELIEKAQHLADRAGHPAIKASVLTLEGLVYQSTGQFKKSQDPSRQALAILLREQCYGMAWERDTAQLTIATADSWMGNFSEVRRQATRLTEEAHDRGDRFLQT
jgi:hypothetical protein